VTDPQANPNGLLSIAALLLDYNNIELLMDSRMRMKVSLKHTVQMPSNVCRGCCGRAG